MQQDLKYYVTENSRKIYDTLFPIQQRRLTAAVAQQQPQTSEWFFSKIQIFYKVLKDDMTNAKEQKKCILHPSSSSSSLCF